MTPKSTAALIAYHEEQAEDYTTLAAIAEDCGDNDKAATHLGFRDLHKQWADQLRDQAVTQVDAVEIVTRTGPIHPLFAAKPLNDNHARHA